MRVGRNYGVSERQFFLGKKRQEQCETSFSSSKHVIWWEQHRHNYIGRQRNCTLAAVDFTDKKYAYCAVPFVNSKDLFTLGVFSRRFPFQGHKCTAFCLFETGHDKYQNLKEYSNPKNVNFSIFKNAPKRTFWQTIKNVNVFILFLVHFIPKNINTFINCINYQYIKTTFLH